MSHLPGSSKLRELKKFADACNPAVLSASRALQFAVNVEEGSLMIGHMPVKLWKMPVPPMPNYEILEDRVLQLVYPLWTVEQRKAVIAEEDGDGDAEMKVYFDDADDQDEMIEDDDSTDNNAEGSEPEQDNMDTDHSNKENIEDEGMTDADAPGSPVSDYTYGDEYSYVPTQQDMNYDDDGPDYMYPVVAGDLAYDAEDAYEEGRPATPEVLMRTDQDEDFDYDSENDITFEGYRGSDESDDEGVSFTSRKPLGSPIRDNWSSLADVRRITAQRNAQPVNLPSMKSPSPPRFFQTPPHIAEKSERETPVYWKTGLTGVVIDWLANPQTAGWQMYLSRVKLGKLGGKSANIDDDVRDGQVIKLTRMSINPASGVVGDQELPRQWLLLQVTYGEGAVKGRQPYWLLALPVCAISDAKLGVEDGPRRVVTACTIGVPGWAPMVHGFGMKRRCFEGFMKACAEGKGQVVMESNEAITL